MKKIYTIGRDEGCDIVIPDSTDVISRLHATIRVESNDKIFITDQSRNGTYVNGRLVVGQQLIKLGDVVKAIYIKENDYNYVLIKSEDETTLHAIIKLK